ncbi:hypothetical protein Lal_00008568 [Lupinus albus]|nr:hypothetical protein Lal_00008568 [Lupinus albus]
MSSQTMSSQNEENEQGTMVNTQTLVTQTQKRKPRGVTSMKSIVRARSNNNKLTVEWNAKGQPCNNKGNVNLKPPAKYANLIDMADWLEFVSYHTQDENFLKTSEQNHNSVSNPIYPYRGVEEKILEQSETPSPSSATVDLDILWVDARRTSNVLSIMKKFKK